MLPQADSEQSERLRPQSAVLPQADSEQSERFRPGASCSPRRTASEATASAPPGRPALLRVRQAHLREGGGFHKESFSCKETQPKPETADVNPPPIPHRHTQAVSALIPLEAPA